MSGLRLATYGTGRLTTEAIRQLARTRHRVVLGVVHSPARAGRDLGELTIGETLGVSTTADLAGALADTDVDVMLYGGLLGEVHERVMQHCADAGVDLVHTCFAHPHVGLAADVRERLSAAALASGARVVGTGLLPGLLLDVLPAVLATGLPDPVSITAGVVSDLTGWGEDVLRHELGIGGTEPGTAWRYDAILRESAYQLSEALGFELEELRSEGGLLMAETARQIDSLSIAVGAVEGFEQRVIGRVGDSARLDLSWISVPDPRDRGLRPGVDITLTSESGGSGRVRLNWAADPYLGTASRMLAAIEPLRRMPPGLHLPTALPIM